MAKCDGCGAGACSCVIRAGQGVAVRGSGSANNPYFIDVDQPDFANALVVNDTNTLNLALVGAGTQQDPLTLTGEVTVAMTGLTDVRDTVPPVPGDVPVWVADAQGTGWRFQPPPTVAAGSLSLRPSSGLIGDGSGGNPIGVSASGIWGVNVGTDAGAVSTSGQLIYVDQSGQLRAAPLPPVSAVAWDAITGKPSVYPSAWTSVTGKPVTFPSTWTSVTGKPLTYPADPHNHDERYYTEAESDARFPAKRPGSPFNGFAVLDYGNNAMGMRWDGSRVIIRVDNTEFGVATTVDLTGQAAAINNAQAGVNNLSANKADSFGDPQTARYAQGPSSSAYNRGMAGAGFFQVWMDNTLQFGRNTSTRRDKEDIQPVRLDPVDVLALEPVTYHRKANESPEREFGMIAEQVNEHVPHIVTWFTRDGEDEPHIDGIRYDLLAVAQQAVLRDQQARIENLERSLATLMEGTN